MADQFNVKTSKSKIKKGFKWLRKRGSEFVKYLSYEPITELTDGTLELTERAKLEPERNQVKSERPIKPAANLTAQHNPREPQFWVADKTKWPPSHKVNWDELWGVAKWDNPLRPEKTYEYSQIKPSAPPIEAQSWDDPLPEMTVLAEPLAPSISYASIN
ncbi:hypothetical protein HDE_04959 [Halotydeus destructor]|nr:hypothetical protein HDE_04959 [Halotydeus destructor]